MSNRQALIEQFLESLRAWKRVMWAGKEAYIKSFNLHPAQVGVLFYIKHHEPVTVKEVAEVMGITPSAATQLVDSIVTAGHIKRTHDRADRRKVRLEVSAKGRALFDKLRRDRLRWMKRILSVLSDSELHQLITIQHKIIKDVSKY